MVICLKLNMKYTKSKKADEKVEKDLKIIKNILVEELKPISIILFGGFGRGEGSYETVGGSIIPLNDYDMYVVTKRKWGTSPVDGGNPVVSGKVAKGFTPGSATPSNPTKFAKRTMLRHGTSNSKSLAQEVGTRSLKKKFK